MTIWSRTQRRRGPDAQLGVSAVTKRSAIMAAFAWAIGRLISDARADGTSDLAAPLDTSPHGFTIELSEAQYIDFVFNGETVRMTGADIFRALKQ